MLNALKFVQGAIQKNLVSPELEHYTIKDGRVTGYNGYMALSAPVPLDMDVAPKADLFYKALAACGDTVAITTTPSGRLHIISGPMSVYVPCIEQIGFQAEPKGTLYPAPAGLSKTFGRMLPFIADDASRPWAMGLSVGRGMYTATNNVILLQVWDGHQLPEFNCPRFAVAEVARIKEDPISVMVDPGVSVSFIYPDGRWLRTQLLAQEWPLEKMSTILDRPSNPTMVPEGFFDAVDRLAPFVTDGPLSPVFMRDGEMTTGRDGAEEGATIKVAGIPAGVAFKLKALQMLRGEVSRIDFGVMPALFFGEQTRGAVVGMNL